LVALLEPRCKALAAHCAPRAHTLPLPTHCHARPAPGEHGRVRLVPRSAARARATRTTPTQVPSPCFLSFSFSYDLSHMHYQKQIANVGVSTPCTPCSVGSVSDAGASACSALAGTPKQNIINSLGQGHWGNPIGVAVCGQVAVGAALASTYDHTIVIVAASNGAVTLFAGTQGTSGATGDEGQATSALLNNPKGVACDR
jgi:hypothetical protein